MSQNLPPYAADRALIDNMDRSAKLTIKPLLIKDWKKIRTGSTTRVSALVDGFEVYFDGVCLADAPERADAFLAVGLLQAMYQNRPLDLRPLPPLSSGLLAHMQEIQDIWCCWNPRLHRINIMATEVETPPGLTNLTFFSGGVVAVHTALTLGERAGRLVFINGFDFEMSATAFHSVYQRVAGIATLLGRELLTVQTNWIAYTRKLHIARSTSHGCCLAAIAYLLNPAEAYIASSTSWLGMSPWGTHPFVDKLWGSDRMRVHHHGKDMTQPEKIAVIAQRPELLQHLRVCSEEPIHNCGRCRNCIRTHAALAMIGADTSAFPVSRGDILKEWLLEVSADPNEKAFLADVLVALKEAGRQDLLKIVADGEKKALRRSVIRRLLHRVLPGMAPKHDASTDLLPWGSGPRPNL